MNLYLPIYKRIEEEVISLIHNIFVDDDQLKVYSLAIGDIIVRCAVEIEALAKDLYINLGGNPNPVDEDGNKRSLYFDTDCMALIVNKWKIDEKKIQIVNPNVFLSTDKSVLNPLHKSHKRGSSGSKWKQAYQEIKHNRAQSIKWASIDNMFNALGALYILNLYYLEEKFWVETSIYGRREFNTESRIFSPFIADATAISMSIDMGEGIEDKIQKTSLNESIYIKKIVDDAYTAIHKMICKTAICSIKKILSKEDYQHILELSVDDRINAFDQINHDVGIGDVAIMKQVFAMNDFHGKINRQEIILNKHEAIYPVLKYVDFLRSEEGRIQIEGFCE